MASYLGLLPDSGAGEATLEQSKITRKFLVKLDNFTDDADVACNVSGLPTPFSVHPNLILARARDFSAERIGNSLYWTVTVEYSTPDKGNSDDENTDPTEDIATLSIAYEDREEPVTGTFGTTRVKVNGITNSAGELYDPAPVKTVSSLVMTITQNYSTYTFPTNVLAYMDCINSDSFLGFSASTCKICSISPKNEKRGDTYYLSVAYVIKVRPTWHLQLLDYGSYYKDSEGNKIEFKSDDGHPYLGLLNGFSGKNADNASAVFLPDKQIYTSVAFSGLGLPTSIGDYKLV